MCLTLDFFSEYLFVVTWNMEAIIKDTRMHFSRMRTGRTLTVFRCLVPGGGCIPKESRNQKKIPPQKIGGSPLTPPQIEDPPEKLEPPWDQTPPRDWPARHAGIPTPPPRGQNDTRLWKYYLGQNFVSAGKYASSPYFTLISLAWKNYKVCGQCCNGSL